MNRLPMNVLVTGSRFPHALEQIAKLTRCGHRAWASDCPDPERDLDDRLVTPSPRDDLEGFFDALEAHVREHAVERILPSFEEVLYLAQRGARFAPATELFAPEVRALWQLHDKAALVALARRLRLPVPPTELARTRPELRALSERHRRFFARPAYSRGGVALYTNAGPHAGALALADCAPSGANPFVVQPFVDGQDLSTYSVVQRGRVAAHVAYVRERTLAHSGSVVVSSVDAPDTLPIVAAIARATDYHGQVSFDFRESRDGLSLVECNPHGSAGIAVMPDGMFDDAMRDRRPERTLLAPAGRRQLLFQRARSDRAHRLGDDLAWDGQDIPGSGMREPPRREPPRSPRRAASVAGSHAGV